jgi:hypothetical protein
MSNIGRAVNADPSPRASTARQNNERSSTVIDRAVVEIRISCCGIEPSNTAKLLEKRDGSLDGSNGHIHEFCNLSSNANMILIG